MNQPSRQPDPLITVPKTVQDEIDRVKQLLAETAEAEAKGDTQVALAKVRERGEVIVRLASGSPLHAALLVAAELGCQGVEFQEIEKHNGYAMVQKIQVARLF